MAAVSSSSHGRRVQQDAYGSSSFPYHPGQHRLKPAAPPITTLTDAELGDVQKSNPSKRTSPDDRIVTNSSQHPKSATKRRKPSPPPLERTPTPLASQQTAIDIDPSLESFVDDDPQPYLTRRESLTHTRRDEEEEVGASAISASQASTQVDADDVLEPLPTVSTGPNEEDSAITNAESPSRKRSRTGSRSSIDAILAEAAELTSAPRARSIPTGHRRNTTSHSLISIDAPTQARNYLTPSATSKKELPNAFVARKNRINSQSKDPAKPNGKKRTRTESEINGEDGVQSEPSKRALSKEDSTISDADSRIGSVDQLLVTDVVHESEEPDPLGPTLSNISDSALQDASLLNAIEVKRRQNTLAARRSRQRKLDYVRNLEALVETLTKERDDWKERAEKAEFELSNHRGD